MTPSASTTLTPNQAEQLHARVRAGEKKTILAGEYGISRETLYGYLKANSDKEGTS
ncbi:helix-turn-helix domain-containing protein [Deinococcus yavapaiensis]|uniref:Helix-turn-helix resolvase-like protein n=1 Tax=Deinococcus yavapaiensis KR-236 TaxID=694435 RepID=A0A318SBQ0_9DEIO|nr:helix-turn-helix domain-containing protein [Deinococcus yavapaiensis]PYE48332.1 helix-turn-helix resolvase-like protein [Deinococcus yavapaiensis KR-236]